MNEKYAKLVNGLSADNWRYVETRTRIDSHVMEVWMNGERRLVIERLSAEGEAVALFELDASVPTLPR